jgi:hypothetical protein
MHFDEPVIIGQLLQIPADGIFGNIEGYTETGGKNLVMQVDLM